jgi:hypothetical protein
MSAWARGGLLPARQECAVSRTGGRGASGSRTATMRCKLALRRRPTIKCIICSTSALMQSRRWPPVKASVHQSGCAEHPDTARLRTPVRASGAVSCIAELACSASAASNARSCACPKERRWTSGMLDADGHLLVTGDESGMVQIWYVHPMHDWTLLCLLRLTWLRECSDPSEGALVRNSVDPFLCKAQPGGSTLNEDTCPRILPVPQRLSDALASCAMEKFVQQNSRNVANISAKFCNSDLPTPRFNVPPARAAQRGAAH